MTEINKDPKQEEVDETTNQSDPIDETNPSEDSLDKNQDNKDEEEQVTLSVKELNVLKKKAEDFERSVELKRLAKLQEKEGEKPDSDLAKEIKELREKVEATQIQSFNNNLTSAYKDFVAEYPWANNDEVFDKIRESFTTVGTESKDQLFLKLKSAVQSKFPNEYEKHLEDKIKAKVLSTKPNPTPDGGSAPADILHKDTSVKTEEDLRRERLGSLLKQHTPWLNKK